MKTGISELFKLRWRQESKYRRQEGSPCRESFVKLTCSPKRRKVNKGTNHSKFRALCVIRKWGYEEFNGHEGVTFFYNQLLYLNMFDLEFLIQLSHTLHCSLKNVNLNLLVIVFLWRQQCVWIIWRKVQRILIEIRFLKINIINCINWTISLKTFIL